MSRRHRADHREIVPDAKYGDLVLAKFMNCLMYQGKKSVTEGIVYGAFETIQAKTRQDAWNRYCRAKRRSSGVRSFAGLAATCRNGSWALPAT